MTLPVNVGKGYVTGTFMDSSGTLAEGTVTFTPSPAKVLDATATPPTTILPQPVVVTLAEGTFLQQLVATDDDDLNPSGWTYTVSFRIKFGPLAVDVAPFSISLPTGGSDSPVDLTLVSPVASIDGTFYTRGMGVPDPTGGGDGETLVLVDGVPVWAPSDSLSLDSRYLTQSGTDAAVAAKISDTTPSASRIAVTALVGPTRINVSAHALTYDRPGIQAVIAAAPAGAELYLQRVGSGDGSLTLDANPLVPKAAGQKFVHERGLLIKQPNLYLPVYDVLDIDDVTIHDLNCLGPSTRPANGVSFRGSSTANYQAAVWTNSHRTKVTGFTHTKNFKIGVNLTAWDTTSGAWLTKSHADNLVEDLLAEGSDFGVLAYGQVRLRLGKVTTLNHVDSSAGTDPNHSIYLSGSPTVRNEDVQIGQVIGQNNTFGHGLALKYTDGLQIDAALFKQFGMLAVFIDTTDVLVGKLQLRDTVQNSDAGAMVQGASPNPQRVVIERILIDDSGDVLTLNSTNAVNFAADGYDIGKIVVVTHRASSTASNAVILTGTKGTAAVKTTNLGAAMGSAQIGKSSLAATDITLKDHDSHNASGVLQVYTDSTGVVYEYDSARHRSGTFTGTGVGALGSGAAPLYTVKNVGGGAGGGGGAPFPLAAGESNMDRGSVYLDDITAQAAGQLILRYFTATKSEVISQIKMVTGATAAGATPTLVKMGVYSVDPSTYAHTLVAATASDTSLFAAADTSYTRSLAAAFTKTSGQLYATAVLVVTAAAVPSFIGQKMRSASTIDNLFAELPRVTAALAGQTDLPSTITSGSLANTRRNPYCELLP